jgi:hypothetical protein
VTASSGLTARAWPGRRGADRPGAVPVTGVSYQRPPGPGAPGLALPPAGQAAAAALAALETPVRLGRRPVLQVHARGITASLAEWPGSVRRQTAISYPAIFRVMAGCAVLSAGLSASGMRRPQPAPAPPGATMRT